MYWLVVFLPLLDNENVFVFTSHIIFFSGILLQKLIVNVDTLDKCTILLRFAVKAVYVTLALLYLSTDL